MKTVGTILFNLSTIFKYEHLVTRAKALVALFCFLSLLSGLILYKVLFLANLSGIPTFWTVYGIIATTFLLTRIPYAYLHRDEHDTYYEDSAYPSVSVVIPAKNEEVGIFRTISTCIESTYPGELECIVIDDGSTDKTKNEVERAQAVFGDKIKLISFPSNKGKREAMAMGIHEARHDIVVFVDSDSFLKKDALKHITEHFLANDKIGAVSGNTKVENADTNLLTKMQSVQYAISFDIYKASESVHHSVTCCPGCFSAYRKRAVKPLAKMWKEQKIFGKTGTFGDDRGLTNFVLKEWNIVYCEKAKATTVVPEKFRVYLRQQLRWKKSWIREGLIAAQYFWKIRHPMASFAFYTHFSFPFVGPILAGTVLVRSIMTNDPLLFVIFMIGFLLLGSVYALFIHVYYNVKYFFYMPVFSLLFISVLIWQMPYALLTVRDTRWGTR